MSMRTVLTNNPAYTIQKKYFKRKMQEKAARLLEFTLSYLISEKCREKFSILYNL